MPIYDYVCSKCHRLTEVVHGIAADGPNFCPECGAEGTMTKVITAPSVHFKGSGWAKKDRSSSSRAAARSTESGTSGDTKGEGTSTDDSSPAKDATPSTTTKAVAASKPESSGSSSSSRGSGSDSGTAD